MFILGFVVVEILDLNSVVFTEEDPIPIHGETLRNLDFGERGEAIFN